MPSISNFHLLFYEHMVKFYEKSTPIAIANVTLACSSLKPKNQMCVHGSLVCQTCMVTNNQAIKIAALKTTIFGYQFGDHSKSFGSMEVIIPCIEVINVSAILQGIV